MFRIFLSVAVVGFLIGLAVTPVFAGPLASGTGGSAGAEAQGSDTGTIGAALAGLDSSSEDARSPSARTVSARLDRPCSEASCAADADSARRILGALLASMGSLETKPDTEPGLPLSR